jgi:D-3-phosphoglycerate dehydrogenase / 2-oxoglutarate reductase
VILIVEPLDPEVMQWLVARHPVRYAPDLSRDPRGLRQAMRNVQALIIPPTVALDADALARAPRLRAVGRLSAGAENIDFDACARAGVEVVRPSDATAQAEAEFMIGALLQMLRRVPVVNAEGLLVGRELGSATVGLIGMGPAAQPTAQLLQAFGARVVGYDPALHANDPLWARWLVEPVSLRELMEQSDAVCVMLAYFTRYQGLLGERYLGFCKANQVLVSLASTSLFDENALADVLGSGRMAAAWFDSLEPGLLAPGRLLHQIDTLQITPRVASTTLESRVRAAWDVARRIDDLLQPGNDMVPAG